MDLLTLYYMKIVAGNEEDAILAVGRRRMEVGAALRLCVAVL